MCAGWWCAKESCFLSLPFSFGLVWFSFLMLQYRFFNSKRNLERPGRQQRQTFQAGVYGFYTCSHSCCTQVHINTAVHGCGRVECCLPFLYLVLETRKREYSTEISHDSKSRTYIRGKCHHLNRLKLLVLLTPPLTERYETLGFEKRDRSHLFQTELEDFLVTDTGRYYRFVRPCTNNVQQYRCSFGHPIVDRYCCWVFYVSLAWSFGWLFECPVWVLLVC